jgi:hypothetical protein
LWASRRGYICGVDECTLIRRLGMPDQIVGPGDDVHSNAWICFTCGETTTSAEPILCPAPCELCGGIVFETWSTPCPEIAKQSRP